MREIMLPRFALTRENLHKHEMRDSDREIESAVSNKSVGGRPLKSSNVGVTAFKKSSTSCQNAVPSASALSINQMY